MTWLPAGATIFSSSIRVDISILKMFTVVLVPVRVTSVQPDGTTDTVVPCDAAYVAILVASAFMSAVTFEKSYVNGLVTTFPYVAFASSFGSFVFS